jgi:hypothetical protein
MTISSYLCEKYVPFTRPLYRIPGQLLDLLIGQGTHVPSLSSEAKFLIRSEKFPAP